MISQFEIEEKLHPLTNELLQLVKQICWNEISENLVFILSDISEVEGENHFIQRHHRNKLNKKKIPKSFHEAKTELKKIYASIYDINLHVYKSEKHRTILDIRYFLKSKLDADFLKTVIENQPMLHYKISIPPYVKKDKPEKFDVNWELGGFRYNWNMLLWRTKCYLK